MVSGLQHEGTMRTVRLVAAIALVARLGLAACDDLIAVTREARHGNDPMGLSSPWCNHYGLLPSESTDLKQDPPLERRPTRLD